MSHPTPMIDLFTINDFFDAATRNEIVKEMKSAGGGPATVYGKELAGAVDSLTRKATRLAVSQATCGRVMQQLLDRKGPIEEHFGVSITACEEPQFLRYVAGDYFVAHQDGNTPLIYDFTRHRKVSITIFLNSQSKEPTPATYCGGELVFHGPYRIDPNFRQPVVEHPGTLVAFRSETTHEVVPVTHGERYTIVSWYR